MGLHDKYRVHEVSKDFNVSTEEVLAVITGFFGENSKLNNMTVLTPEQLDVIFDHFSQKNGALKSLAEYFASMPTEEDREKKKAEQEATKKAAEEAARKEAERKAAEAAAAKLKAEQEARKAAEEEKKKAQAVAAAEAAAAKAAAQKKNAQKEKKRDEFKTRVVPVGKGIEQTSPVTVIERDEKSPDINAKYVKVVDTRKQTNVNLSKYDERLSDIAGEHDKRDYGKSKQKIKSNKNRRPNNYNSKREDELAKLKRLEQYEKDKKKHLSNIVLPEEISVNELASSLHTTNAEVVKKLMGLGIMASSSQIIDYDTASLVAEELGATVSKQVVVTIEDKLIDDTEDKQEDLEPRSPVVVVMGHVDHGKTSLLDAIKNTNVAAGEAGGITQHIGAYTVKINGRNITFLDTPGHAAFTSMRARGAQVTDIAILVVAGDDGIMPQTVEAINHAKAANVPIIVAVNKMDKPEANFDRVLQALTEHELVPEQWGGDVICVPVSAVKHEGIENLLEMVQLVADMADLKANPNRKAKGTVIEAKLDKGRGPVATVLVQNGTLHTGDLLVAGTSVAKVRIMMDDKGKRITEAAPSTPVEITGFSEVPSAGDLFYVVDDERMARELVEQRKQEQKDALNTDRSGMSLDDLFSQIQQGNVKELNIIVKADVQGSAEAVKSSLEKLSNEEVRVKVIHCAVGGITESDVMLASASKAIIVGFNVRPDPNARTMAEKDKVDMRLYRIIYDCTREIEDAMKGMLAPKFREVSLGTAEVRQTFKVSGVGTIAGCYVKNGKILRSAKVRLIRDSIVVYEGQIDSLKRFKDDAKEVAEGYECGIGLDKFNDVKDGDIIEAYIDEEIKN